MSTQLRELFDGAAESQPPHDLAARAVASARSRRRQRYTVAGSVLAAAAVVLGFVMIGSSQRLDGVPRPNEVAGLPDQLPAADGLPTLTADSMPFASAAYVVDGEVVVVDAATGDGALVDFDTTPPGYVGNVIPGIGPDASLALSADGRFLMVSSGATSLSPGREWLWLVDVATGQVGMQSSLTLAPARDAGPALLNRMAWSPTGQTLACVCAFGGDETSSPELTTTEMAALGDDLVIRSVGAFEVSPRQISWGTDGLLAQLDELDGDWRLVPTGSAAPNDPETWPQLESVLAPESIDLLVTAVVMGQSRQGGFLGVTKVFRDYWIVNDVQDWTVPSVSVRPVLGALGDSYFTVFTDWKGTPVDYKVTRIDSNGETTLTLTTLPPGATTVSFASDLVD